MSLTFDDVNLVHFVGKTFGDDKDESTSVNAAVAEPNAPVISFGNDKVDGPPGHYKSALDDGDAEEFEGLSITLATTRMSLFLLSPLPPNLLPLSFPACILHVWVGQC